MYVYTDGTKAITATLSDYDEETCTRSPDYLPDALNGCFPVCHDEYGEPYILVDDVDEFIRYWEAYAEENSGAGFFWEPVAM